MGGKLTGGPGRGLIPLPASAPTPPVSPTPAAPEQPHNEEQQDRADRCIDDGADYSGTEVHADTRQQPAADEGADDPDQQVANDSETGASDDFAGKPA